MVSPKQVLVVTTSDLGELKIINYLKPVSAHVVAGTNVFSDFAASVTDFFGGRSGTYQKQLASLYDEAIERIKFSAFELGANCVLGLKVDIDEISGKNKAMFMITAVGTAAVAESPNKSQNLFTGDVKLENVSIEKINTHKRKNQIIKESNAEYWGITEDVWDFISDNQIEEVFPALIRKYKGLLANLQVEAAKDFFKKIMTYLERFPEEKKSDIIYLAIFKENDEKVACDLSWLIHELQLLDLKLVLNVLANDDFENQKKVVRMLAYDKPFYNKEDIADFEKIKDLIRTKLSERGIRSMKKQLLSSKEKEVWLCDCGQSNEIDIHCTKCGKDIYGFKANDLSPEKAIAHIDQKIALIAYFIS
jgi:uncharacterized protein YbjQ (UPF0145 family)/CDGSH-type Zn-finger protein